MGILSPVHHRGPSEHRVRRPPDAFASRWKTTMPISSLTVKPSDFIHETTEQHFDPLAQLALGSENAHKQQHMPGTMPEAPHASPLLNPAEDRGRRSDLRELGYSDKIVEKLTPYQVHWLHRYHIYNHADEILHTNNSDTSDSAQFVMRNSHPPLVAIHGAYVART